MPPLVWRKTLRSQADLRCQAKLELIVRDLQECKQFSCQDTDVLLVDQSVRELESPPTDGDIAIAKTIENDRSMSLHSVCVHRYDFVECIQCDIAARHGSISGH